MANITKREFDILDLSGQRYLEWKVDALAHLKANCLENTIAENNSATSQQKAKAIIFLRHHLHESLKSEYLLLDDPKELWDNLEERYGHQKKVLLPRAQYEWTNLRFQDFKSISDYNSALFKVTTTLKLCCQNIIDHEMLEKTFSTMHATNVVLQQQYRNQGFKKYSDLITVLLVAEQNNELLMKNHNMRPTGSSPSGFGNPYHGSAPETNVIRGGACGNSKRGRGNGRNKGPPNKGYKYQGESSSKGKGKFKSPQTKTHERPKSSGECYKCGIKGHWANEFCTAKHLVKLYQASTKGKGKIVEANYADDINPVMPKFDVSDFYMDDAEIGDEMAFGGATTV